MSIYSLQTECLENIEAFNQEKFNAEMNVLESFIDMVDKTMTIMELSNRDIPLPDCSLFMESTFFMEDENTTGNGQENPPQQQNADNGTTQNTQNDANNNNDRVTNKPDEYNKTHHFRQAKTNGKLENIFISILKFIPRLLILPFKVLKNRKDTTNMKTTASATPEEKQKMLELFKNGQVETVGDVKVEDGKFVIVVTDKNGKQYTETLNSEGVLQIIKTDLGQQFQKIKELEEKFKNADLTADQPIISDGSNDNTPQNNEMEVIEIGTEQFINERDKLIKEIEGMKPIVQEAIDKVNNTIKTIESGQSLSQKSVLKYRKNDLNLLKGYMVELNSQIELMNTNENAASQLCAAYNQNLNKIKQNVDKINNASAQNDKAIEKGSSLQTTSQAD